MTVRRARALLPFAFAATLAIAAVPRAAAAGSDPHGPVDRHRPGAVELVAIAVDGKARLVDGEIVVDPSTIGDVVHFYRVERRALIAIGRVSTPVSFMGPPSSIVLMPDGRTALVSASMTTGAAPGTMEPHRSLAVIDLAASPITVAATLQLDAPTTSLAMSADGRTVLALHGDADRATVVAVDDGVARVAGTYDFPRGSAPLAAAFDPASDEVLITFSGSDRVGLFALRDGRLSTPARREMTAGVHPTMVTYCGRSGYAVVANYGRVTGDVDTVSLVRVRPAPARVIDTLAVGPSPEGLACYRDGRYVAVATQNMSTVARTDPLHASVSRLAVLRIVDGRLARIAAWPIGPWAQGVVFLRDSRTILVQSAASREVASFAVRGDRVMRMPRTLVFEDGSPVGFGLQR